MKVYHPLTFSIGPFLVISAEKTGGTIDNILGNLNNDQQLNKQASSSKLLKEFSQQVPDKTIDEELLADQEIDYSTNSLAELIEKNAEQKHYKKPDDEHKQSSLGMMARAGPSSQGGRSSALNPNAKCGDLFSDYENLSDLYSYLPVHGIGILHVAPIQFDLESGLKYSSNTSEICSGKSNYHKDLCFLECDNKPNGGVAGQPLRARGAYEALHAGKEMFAGDAGDFGFTKANRQSRDSYHHVFRCLCTGDEKGRELCFWAPVEQYWANKRSCHAYNVYQKKSLQSLSSQKVGGKETS